MIAFDHTARIYDQEFTRSPIGVMQRKRVRRFLENNLSDDHPADILELNCGTGEDAVWLAANNHSILATDISAEMVDIARQKAALQQAGNNIRFKVMDILASQKSLGGEKYDLVFSNFGGFNCLDEQQFAGWLKEQLPELLKPGGKLVVVLMSVFCAWESLYFLSKGQFGKAFRRLSKGPAEGRLSASSVVNTWYYSPAWIRRQLPENLTLTAVKPIGLFIPPSCLNSFFSTRKTLLAKLEQMENGIGQAGAAAFLSDHYLAEIEWKPL